ncbi:H-NS histone family protein [Comamonas sp. w2-DMI]|uniref:H-NS histone family protein n=1 Tax=Comamonas sp. w2-DMI TaxID=3126391 RepID=UPI0032E45EF2
MQDYQTLIQKKAELDKRIAEARATEAKEALAKVQELIRDFGFTTQQVFPLLPSRKKAEVKYTDPATGATWSGRGKPPRWIEGKDRKPFEKQVSEATTINRGGNDANNPFPVQ